MTCLLLPCILYSTFLITSLHVHSPSILRLIVEPKKEGTKKMNGYHSNGSGPSHNGPSADQVQIPIGPTNQPRVLIRQLDNMNAVFNLSGVETGFANSLRRVIMADVPTICTCTSSSTILSISFRASLLSFASLSQMVAIMCIT